MGKAQPKILSVGQCGFDGPNIRRMLEEKLGAQVDSADSLEETQQMLQEQAYSLVLVNRELHQDGSSGIELIGQIAPSANAPVMLVSNFDDAQQQAQAKGAIRGFGKAALHDEATLELLRSAIGQD